MIEVFGRPDDIAVWHRAVNGEMPDWNEFLSEYTRHGRLARKRILARVAAANPDAVVLLSSRDTEGWWKSAINTIFDVTRREITDRRTDLAGPKGDGRRQCSRRRFTPNWQDETEAKRAFEAHNANVRGRCRPTG